MWVCCLKVGGEEQTDSLRFVDGTLLILFPLWSCSSGALSSLTLTAFSSGHTLGGTIWKIRSPSSGTILHAVGMNHTKERHLDGTALLKEKGEGIHEGLGRPDLLITDVDRVQWKNVKRRERDGALLRKCWQSHWFFFCFVFCFSFNSLYLIISLPSFHFEIYSRSIV